MLLHRKGKVTDYFKIPILKRKARIPYPFRWKAVYNKVVSLKRDTMRCDKKKH